MRITGSSKRGFLGRRLIAVNGFEQSGPGAAVASATRSMADGPRKELWLLL